ncbi:MAG: outer membrane beta-barrel protein [Pseudomonadota bacterium]
MGNASQSLLIGALASTLVAGSAMAADLTPPPVIDFEPEYEHKFGGNLYLRGHVGIGHLTLDDTYNVLYDTALVVDNLASEFDGVVFGGLGVGYRFNKWFRTDIYGELRKSTYYGLDRYTDAGGTIGVFDGTNEYDANLTTYLAMANAYVDLGTYAHITPYVGGGIGVALHEISGYSDTNVPNLGVAYADDNEEYQFAWALYAGLGYKVNDKLTMDLGYRYLNLGDAESGDVISYIGTNNIVNPQEFRDIVSHDFMFGMRWELGGFGHQDTFSGY